MPPIPPLVRKPPRPIPGFPETFLRDEPEAASTLWDEFQYFTAGVIQKIFPETPIIGKLRSLKRNTGTEDYINPPYKIANDVKYGLSDRTVHTNILHHNGIREYDAHNLYGTCMTFRTNYMDYD